MMDDKAGMMTPVEMEVLDKIHLASDDLFWKTGRSHKDYRAFWANNHAVKHWLQRIIEDRNESRFEPKDGWM